MKKYFIITLILFFGTIGTASASPYTWVDYIDFPDIYLDEGESYSYIHNLTDDGYNTIFGGDIISDYTLTLELYDDGGFFDGFELAFVDQPGIFGDGFYNFSGTSTDFGFSILGLVSLNLFGVLDVTIQSIETPFGQDDFYIDSSTLVANGWTHDHVPVPEPSTVLLMGLGLAGVVGLRKRRKK